MPYNLALECNMLIIPADLQLEGSNNKIAKSNCFRKSDAKLSYQSQTIRYSLEYHYVLTGTLESDMMTEYYGFSGKRPDIDESGVVDAKR